MPERPSWSRVRWSWKEQAQWSWLQWERTPTTVSWKWKFNRMKTKHHFSKNWLYWLTKSARSVWSQLLAPLLLCSSTTFTTASTRRASSKVSSLYKPFTRSSSTSLSPSVLSSSPSQKDFPCQLPLPWLIQLERWRNKTTWSDIFKPVRPWEEPITSARIKLELSLRTSWLSPKYSSNKPSTNHWRQKSYPIIPAKSCLFLSATTPTPTPSSLTRREPSPSNRSETKQNALSWKCPIEWATTTRSSETKTTSSRFSPSVQKERKWPPSTKTTRETSTSSSREHLTSWLHIAPSS